MAVQGSARTSDFAEPAHSPGVSRTGEDRYSTGATARRRIHVTLNIRLCRS